MVERQNLPRPAPEVSEDGVPATDEIPEDVLVTGDQLEGELPPLDRPQAAKDWGTTASEQLGTEPAAVRRAREVPDAAVPDAFSDTSAEGQLLEPGVEGGLPDDEADAVGDVDPGLEDTFSAEEAAVRVVEEPAGLNYDSDPGYVDPGRSDERGGA